MQARSNYDLSKGETPESTTAYGLHFLEMIRRTKDKRSVVFQGWQWPMRNVRADMRDSVVGLLRITSKTFSLEKEMRTTIGA